MSNLVCLSELDGPLKKDVPFGTGLWFIYAGISTFLVVFAGLMSGLTLGLMSLGVVDLEILQRSGTPKEKHQASFLLPLLLRITPLFPAAIFPVALPIFLDKMFDPVTAVTLSITFVLAFGEVLPQAICARYGLAIGANLVWLVKVVMVVCYPMSYPVGKLTPNVIDILLQLSCHEADNISVLSREAMGRILARGHSRVPVFAGSPRNIIGLLLVKSLLTVRPEAETPVNAVSIRKIPRVPADMPLYDILNEFQKGNSHMAAVVKAKMKRKPRHTTHHTHNVNHEERWSYGPKQHDDENGKADDLEDREEEIVDETDEYVDVHRR
ncbi:hypothetical protein SELMODRAFT_431347 [Selaginella moellendorffii]|uniref:CNNM transmembrane domain-containing protein n=1 Tax=Selaginella moellendorffii TaxID=88036 RepID=D8TCA9_SELML|nr:hypothetical protein SELMODRAFT_431347 [Selaginella moellendorffii]